MDGEWEGDKPHKEQRADVADAEKRGYQQRINERQEELRQIAAGTHGDLRREVGLLMRLRDRKIQAARAYHERSVKNRRELAEFEKVNAQATYEAELEEVKESLQDVIEQEVKRVGDMMEEAKKEMEMNDLSAAAERKRAEKRHREPRHMASDGPKRGKPKLCPDGMVGKAAAIKLLLPNPSLSEEEIRKDLCAIVQDWRERAVQYLRLVDHTIVVTAEDDTLEYTGEEGTMLFRIGDRVTVISRVTEEEFNGTITNIAAEEVGCFEIISPSVAYALVSHSFC
ncbi:unnamed protein product [Chrysoparadoxa australica]